MKKSFLLLLCICFIKHTVDAASIFRANNMTALVAAGDDVAHRRSLSDGASESKFDDDGESGAARSSLHAVSAAAPAGRPEFCAAVNDKELLVAVGKPFNEAVLREIMDRTGEVITEEVVGYFAASMPSKENMKAFMNYMKVGSFLFSKCVNDLVYYTQLQQNCANGRYDKGVLAYFQSKEALLREMAQGKGRDYKFIGSGSQELQKLLLKHDPDKARYILAFLAKKKVSAALASSRPTTPEGMVNPLSSNTEKNKQKQRATERVDQEALCYFINAERIRAQRLLMLLLGRGEVVPLPGPVRQRSYIRGKVKRYQVVEELSDEVRRCTSCRRRRVSKGQLETYELFKKLTTSLCAPGMVAAYRDMLMNMMWVTVLQTPCYSAEETLTVLQLFESTGLLGRYHRYNGCNAVVFASPAKQESVKKWVEAFRPHKHERDRMVTALSFIGDKAASKIGSGDALKNVGFGLAALGAKGGSYLLNRDITDNLQWRISIVSYLLRAYPFLAINPALLAYVTRGWPIKQVRKLIEGCVVAHKRRKDLTLGTDYRSDPRRATNSLAIFNSQLRAMVDVVYPHRPEELIIKTPDISPVTGLGSVPFVTQSLVEDVGGSKAASELALHKRAQKEASRLLTPVAFISFESVNKRGRDYIYAVFSYLRKAEIEYVMICNYRKGDHHEAWTTAIDGSGGERLTVVSTVEDVQLFDQSEVMMFGKAARADLRRAGAPASSSDSDGEVRIVPAPVEEGEVSERGVFERRGGADAAQVALLRNQLSDVREVSSDGSSNSALVVVPAPLTDGGSE